MHGTQCSIIVIDLVATADRVLSVHQNCLVLTLCSLSMALMFISNFVVVFQAMLCHRQKMNTTPTISIMRREWVLMHLRLEKTAAVALEDGDTATGKTGRLLQKLSPSYYWSLVHPVTQMRMVKQLL